MLKGRSIDYSVCGAAATLAGSGRMLIAVVTLLVLTCSPSVSAKQKRALTATGKSSVSSGAANTLTAAEKAAGWKLLFDGKTTTGWRGFKKPEFPKQGWVVEDGCLKLNAKGGRDSLGGGDIITTDKFTDFELQFEWRISPGGNSGVKYLITEERSGPIGHEYQVIDDARHSDAKLGTKRTTAALYDVMPPSGQKRLQPVGQFNHSRIIVRGKHVEHWLNGLKTLEYELGSEALKAGIAESKFKDVAGWGTKFSTPILLQDHGDEVCYRNLKIRELPAK